MTRKELNRLNTINDIENGFLRLYEKEGIDGVNVAAICQESQVSRSTFYLYFADKYAVLQQVEERLLGQLWEYCGDLPDVLMRGEGSENARKTVRHIRENIDWYRALLGQKGDPMFTYRWKRDIDKSLRKKLRQRNISEEDAVIQGVIFASSLIGIYTYIIFEEPDISEERLVNYMDQLLDRILIRWSL
jgi:AcrR family transcriptional regulator